LKKRFSVTGYVLRNIAVRRLRNGLTVCRLAVLVAFFVLFSALSEGAHDYMVRSIADLPKPDTTGLIVMWDRESDTYNSSDLLAADRVLQEAIRPSGATGHTAGLYEQQFAMDESEGFMGQVYSLVGVDPAIPGVWKYYASEVGPKLSSGRLLSGAPSDSACVVLGHGLKDRFFPNASVGDRISFVPVNMTWDVVPRDRDANGVVNISRIPEVEVHGILKPDYGTDGRAFFPLDFLARQFLQYNGTTNTTFYQQILMIIDDASNIDFNGLESSLKSEFRSANGWDSRYNLEWSRQWYDDSVSSFKDMDATLDGWLMVLGLVGGILIVLGTTNNMTMSVYDQRREIATLKATGIDNRGVYRLILSHGMLLCSFGLVAGLAAGWGISILFDFGYRHSWGGMFFTPATVDHVTVLLALGLVALSGALSSIYPAYRVSRLRPVEALRYE